jgi:dTDP-4-dehydrorhamnose 3,5-epimerase
MQIEDCHIAGLKRIRPKVLTDRRGVFAERYNAKHFAASGLPAQFVQDNYSRSLPGVLRGLHYQHTPPLGKLVGVVRGHIWDVAVDIRPHSPTFGQHLGMELSGENHIQFWIPAGFAHGFCVLGDEPADVIYKIDGMYNANGENGIQFDDADLNIPWPIKNPILSDRDQNLMSWSGYCAHPVQWESAA